MTALQTIDWTGCPLVEFKPEILSGAPVLLGTRMPVQAIIDNSDYGVPPLEIAEQFELPLSSIEAVLNYAQSHRIAHRL